MDKGYHQPQEPELQPLSPQSPLHNQSVPIHFVYEATPCTKELAHSAAIPNAVHYNPFQPDLDPQVIAYSEGLQCSGCQTYVNRHCEVKRAQNIWICCICGQPNSLGNSFHQCVLEDETYDIYAKPKGSSERKLQKCYLFLIDLCISSKQMKAVQQSLLAFIKAKSEQRFEGVELVNKIGIITFSKFVYCYELSSSINTVISISAQKDYDTSKFYSFLGLDSIDQKEVLNKYFLDIRLGREKIQKRIKNIKAEGSVQHQRDPLHRCRSKRAYGQALNLALSLCENIQAQCRIVSLVGGPCTHGMGTTIGTSFKQHMRSLSDLQKGENIHYFQSASLFYQCLKLRAEGKGVVLDFFIFSIEETGLTEMYDLIRTTGGLLVLGEQFAGDLQIFPKSFAKAYIQAEGNDLACSLGSSCFVSVACSRDIKINGALGTCKPIECKKGREYVSEKAIGYGDTNVWGLGGISCYRTLTFFYELSTNRAHDTVYYLQFKTTYKDYWGFKKTRITTVKKMFSNNTAVIADNFNQEAAIVAVARWYLFKSQFQPKSNLRLWLDKLLVRWTLNFAKYSKGDCQSFTLCQKMKYLPQFFYHFRRNPMVRRAGLSCDELTYHTHTLNIETVEHCITIIQPALLSYTIEKPWPSPVRLQEQQMKSEAILVLDSHFYVLVWYGENIEYWEKQEYHKQKQYQHVKVLMEAPQEDVDYLLNSRFPYPGYYHTSRGSSKQRILKSKISPVASEVQNENAMTDDKSFYAFMKALVQIIVHNKTS